HDLPHCAAKFPLFVGVGDGVRGAHRPLPQGGLGDVRRQLAVTDELGAAAGDVDHLAHQVAVYLEDEVVQIEVEILNPRRQLGGEVVAQVFRIQVVQVAAGVDKGAPGFGHLLAVDGQKAVDANLGGGAVTGAAEHGGPEQGVEIDDILADKVVQLGAGVGAPEAVEIQPLAVAEVLEAGHVADG